jgi:hypothetical protein
VDAVLLGEVRPGPRKVALPWSGGA